MQYSNIKENDASCVPSLFASSGMSNRHKTDGESYLHKRFAKKKGPDRQKVNILALVDGAIEDGATEEAKQKASAERAVSEAPVPGIKSAIPAKKSTLKEQNSISELKARLQSPRRRRSKSTDRKVKQTHEFIKNKDLTLDSEKVNHSVSPLSWNKKPLVHDTPKPQHAANVTPKSPHTPAWRARLNKQTKERSDPAQSEQKPSGGIDKKRIIKEPSPKIKTKSKSPKPGKRAERGKSSVQIISLNPCAFELPLSRDDQPHKPKGLPPLRTDKLSNSYVAPNAVKVTRPKKDKEKKKKKKKKNNPSTHKVNTGGKKCAATGLKIRVSTTKIDFGKANYEESESSFNNDDAIFGSTHSPVKSDGLRTKVGAPSGDKYLLLRKKLDETQKQVDNVSRVSKQELSDMKKDHENTKETIKFRLMKDHHAQGKKNDVKYQAYKKVVDEKQKEIDELRSANQKLRTTIQKLPKQMSEVIFSNQSLEEANEEVASHIGGLVNFTKKLQTDQDRFIHSKDKCKNEYLPRYRQQLWDSRQHLESETKIKTFYRDSIIKITKQIEKSRNVGLIEQISSMVLETEGEFNPKFDPEFLSSENVGFDDSSSSDYDENDSSDSSDSSSSSDSDI